MESPEGDIQADYLAASRAADWGDYGKPAEFARKQ